MGKFTGSTFFSRLPILVDYMLLIVSFTKERTFYCNFPKNKLPIGFCQGYWLNISEHLFSRTSQWVPLKRYATILKMNSFTSSFQVFCLGFRLFFSGCWQCWGIFPKFFQWLLLHPINRTFSIIEMGVAMKINPPVNSFHLR